jgi:ribose transport system substrate-binding protein
MAQRVDNDPILNYKRLLDEGNDDHPTDHTGGRGFRAPHREPTRVGGGDVRCRRRPLRSATAQTGEAAGERRQSSNRRHDVKVRGVAALLVAGLMAALAITASAQTTGRAKQSGGQKVGVSLAGYSTDFWAAYVQYEKGFAKTDGLQLVGPVSANGDAAKQATDITTLLNEGVKALIVNPVDSAAIATSVAAAKAKGVPVIMMDVGPSSGKVYSVVRANNLLFGQQACEYIGTFAHGAGHAAVLEGDLASINGRDRAVGFTTCMKKNFPNMKVLKYATKWDTPTAVNDAKTALSAYKDLKGIYNSFSGPDPGIIAAMKATGRYGKVGSSKANRVVLVETDGVPFELQDIRKGILDATVSQPVDGYAQYALLYAKDAIAGKPAPKVGTKTDHGSSIVNLNGSPEDALASTFVTKTNAGDSSLWGNSFKKG